MNKKYIIILGILTLLLIVIFGTTTYYNENYKERVQESNILSNNKVRIVPVPRFIENYPISISEMQSFENFCARTATPHFMASVDEFTEEDILANCCRLHKVAPEEESDFTIENKHRPVVISVKNLVALSQSEYVAMAVNKDDLLKKSKDLLQSEESKYSICIATTPSLINPFRKELLEKDPLGFYITFPEGNIMCKESSAWLSSNLVLSGLVPGPETDSLFDLKIYLVPDNEDLKNNILNSRSFSDIEEILSSHFLLWQMGKPII